MSAVAKGSRSERDAKSDLEEEGFIVFKPQKTSRFGTQDIFNMFDIVAIKDSQLRFVQVKTNSTAGFLKKLKKWGPEHIITNVSWELWVRIDQRKNPIKGKWKKYLY